MLSHERSRRQIAKASLLASPVVEDFDVLGDGLLGIATRREAAMVNQFVFQCPQPLSIGALSQQLPLRIMETCMRNWRSNRW